MTLPFVSESTSSRVSRRSTKRFFDLETKRRVVAEFDALERIVLIADHFCVARGSFAARSMNGVKLLS
jgi:hypothetical protein